MPPAMPPSGADAARPPRSAPSRRRRGRGAAPRRRLARTLDQLLIEEIEPARSPPSRGFPRRFRTLAGVSGATELILLDWPQLLAERGQIDLARRRNLLLDAVQTLAPTRHAG